MYPIKCTLIFKRMVADSRFMSELLRDDCVERQSISKREY